MKAKKLYKYVPQEVSPPTDTLLETMEFLCINQEDLAKRTEISSMSISRILKGTQPITHEIALKLEMATGVDAEFWVNREAQYRSHLARLEQDKRNSELVGWLKTQPLKELQSRKIVTSTEKSIETLNQVLSFYGVSSPHSWEEVWGKPVAAARRSTKVSADSAAVAAWLCLAKKSALRTSCQPFDKEKAQIAILQLRNLTILNINEALKQAHAICASFGCALTLTKEFPKAPWSGATEWLDKDKVAIYLNIRGKAEDKFWFSFFHELGHVLHGKKQQIYLDDGKYDDDPEEIKANEFAAELLIPKSYNKQIEKITSSAGIRSLAKELKISPGVVAGRYQHLTKNYGRFKDCIKPLQWADET
ncbi:MAG: hypothetical protein RL095_269 [Verrucomicrobiota bacterium]|jgi:addiction module HigA family antidote